MMILYDAIKTIQIGSYVPFFKKNKNPFLINFYEKKRVFLYPDCLLILFVIFPWSHDLEQVTPLSVGLGVRCTLTV